VRINWNREEILLLLSYYDKMNSGDMHKTHHLVIELSNKIRDLPINQEYSRISDKFRNPNGIALKLANFLYIDPKYVGKGMRGCSKLDKTIFNEYFMKKQSFNTSDREYPFQFDNWFSSNEGGVRRPFKNDSGRPLGDSIIEGRIHRLIKSMVLNFRENPGKYICILVGGPGNGKTDLMEFAAKEFITKNNEDWSNWHSKISADFSKNNRQASINLMNGTKLILTQDASQRDINSKDFCEAIYNDFKQIDDMKSGLCIICMNRGILEEIMKRSSLKGEKLNEYAKLISEIYRFNSIDAYIGNLMIWGNNDVTPYNLYTWSMDFDSLFDKSSLMKLDNNLIHEIFQKANCYNNFISIDNKISPLYFTRSFIESKELNLNFSKILRSYEILNGKRFTYRELFNLIGHLFHFSEQGKNIIDKKLNQYARISDEKTIERFIILFELYKETYTYRFFGGFICPSNKLRDNCINVHNDKKRTELINFFEALIKSGKNESSFEINFIKYSSFFDPINCSDQITLTDKNGNLISLDELSKKIIYNSIFDIKDFENIISPLEIEIISCLIDIKDEYCLKVDTDQINFQRLNALDSLKSFLNILIISFIKRSIFLPLNYIKDKIHIDEFIELIEGDLGKKQNFALGVFLKSLNSKSGKIEISLSSSIGQTASQFKNNVSYFGFAKQIYAMNPPQNELPSIDQIILQYNENNPNIISPIVITYKLFREIKRSSQMLLEGCFDKNFMLWQELKKNELVIKSIDVNEIEIKGLGKIEIKKVTGQDNFEYKLKLN
jgi:hypothetical protein